ELGWYAAVRCRFLDQCHSRNRCDRPEERRGPSISAWVHTNGLVPDGCCCPRRRSANYQRQGRGQRTERRRERAAIREAPARTSVHSDTAAGVSCTTQLQENGTRVARADATGGARKPVQVGSRQDRLSPRREPDSACDL